MSTGDRDCQLLLPWTIDYQSGITTCANLWDRDCQDLLEHNMYVERKHSSTLFTKTRGRLINYKFSDLSNKDNKFWHNTGQLVSRLSIHLHGTRIESIHFRARTRLASWLPPIMLVLGLTPVELIDLASCDEVSGKGDTRQGNKWAGTLQVVAMFYK